MSGQLDKASAEYQAGNYKKAVRMLWDLSLGIDDSRQAIELATMIRGKVDGSLAGQCDDFIRATQRAIAAAKEKQAADRASELEATLKKDPVALARWAAQAGLRWLQIESAEDAVAASLEAAFAAAGEGSGHVAPPCFIDGVEAEGWRLEHVQRVFEPTKIQTTIFRGADLGGGEPVQGERTYLYLFRRVDNQEGK